MDSKRQFALGIFFLTALSILAFYTLFLTDFTLFRDPEQEVVYFPKANGLREGDPVMVSGLRVGRVKTLEFEISAPPEKRIRATLNLNEKIELLEGARITIKESTLLGGRQIDIFPGAHGGIPLERDEGGALFGEVEENPFESLSSLGAILDENRESVRNIVANLDGLVTDLRAGRGVVGALLSNDEAGDDLAGALANLRRFTGDMNDGEGLVPALVHDAELVDAIKGTVDSLRRIGEDIQAGQGLAGRLIYDSELADQVAAAVDTFADIGASIREGDGVLGKLLSDEELGEEVAAALRNFKEVSANLQEVSAKLSEGGGSLGKLMNDEELYEEALAAVKLITRSLEDFREAAPVGTFTGAVFGAF